MNYTTVEQNKRLLELGLDPNTADMNEILDRRPESIRKELDDFVPYPCLKCPFD